MGENEGEEDEEKEKERYNKIMADLLELKNKTKSIKHIVCLVRHDDDKIGLFIDGAISDVAVLAAAGARVTKNLLKKSISERIDRDLET